MCVEGLFLLNVTVKNVQHLDNLKTSVGENITVNVAKRKKSKTQELKDVSISDTIHIVDRSMYVISKFMIKVKKNYQQLCDMTISLLKTEYKHKLHNLVIIYTINKPNPLSPRRSAFD